MTTWYPAYLDKQDIVDFCTIQNSNLTTGDIKDVDVRLADIDLFSFLYTNGGIESTYTGTVSGSAAHPVDRISLLWAASLAFNCELLSYRGVISYNIGEVSEQRIGNLQAKFQRLPMFFMRNTTYGIDRLKPYNSFKEIGEKFCDTYISLTQNKSGNQYGKPVTAQDWTSRGYGANANLNDYLVIADAELTGTS